MTINTIRNNTDYNLELWEAPGLLVTLTPGNAAHQLPVTISSVRYREVSYHNKNGAFQNGDSYAATLDHVAPSGMNTIIFTGNQGNVTFT